MLLLFITCIINNYHNLCSMRYSVEVSSKADYKTWEPWWNPKWHLLTHKILRHPVTFCVSNVTWRNRNNNNNNKNNKNTRLLLLLLIIIKTFITTIALLKMWISVFYFAVIICFLRSMFILLYLTSCAHPVWPWLRQTDLRAEPTSTAVRHSALTLNF